MNGKRLYTCMLLLFVLWLGQAQAAHGSRPKEKEWAFLIFLNGHNNLAPFGDLNLNQLEKIGSTDDVDVIVQWAKLGNEKTYRLRVEKDTDTNKVTSPFIETLPRQDMGDYKALVEFVRWSHERFPAKRYFVSFWDHGSGWHRSQRKTPTRGVSHDDYSGNHITTEQMGIAMREISAIIGHKVDIVGADACLMAMAEVGSEMVDGAEYFVASEETEPGLGWPYDTFFERWAANPKASSAEITSYLVEEYFKYLSPTEQITLSSFHLGALPQLWDGMRALSNSLMKLSTTDMLALRNATRPAVAFYYTDYVDLGDWMKKAFAHPSAALDKGLIKSVSDTVTAMVPANKVSPKYQNAEGIAFWVPPTKGVFHRHIEAYRKLRFTKETGWDQVLERMLTLPVCAPHPNGQWANAVLSFSSQYGESTWSASQVLGPCDTETYGDNGTAWAPKEMDGGDEYLTVQFATPVYATGAVVRETMGSGFVTKIETIDAAGESRVVWEGEDLSVIGAVADFEASWPRTDYLVNALKVSITTKKNPGVWKEVDSIQLIGAN